MKLVVALLILALFSLGCTHRAVVADDPVMSKDSWVVTAGGSTADIGGMDTDDQGNVLLTGTFDGQATFGDTTLKTDHQALFVARLSSAGKFLWAISAQSPESILSRDIALDRDGNAYITGSFLKSATFGTKTVSGPFSPLVNSIFGSLFVAKISPDGTFLWVEVLGEDAVFYGEALAVDGQGSVHVAGQFCAEQTSLGDTELPKDCGVFITKLSSSGEVLWAKATRGGQVSGLDVDPAGNVLATGMFFSTFKAGGSSFTATEETDIWLTKLSPEGQFLWTVTAGGGKHPCETEICMTDLGHDVAVDHQGNAYVTGTFYQQADFGEFRLDAAHTKEDLFVAKLSADGTFLWAISGGGSEYDTGYSIAVDASGNALVTGDVHGDTVFDSLQVAGRGGQDALLLEVSADGEFLSAASGGGPLSDLGWAIATGADGACYMAGTFEKRASFGGFRISDTSAFGSDLNIFVWKVMP